MSRHLTAYTVADTHQIGEMRSILYDVYDARFFDIRGERTAFQAQASYLALGSSNISYCAYECPVTLEFPEADYVRFQICLSGQGQTTSGGTAADFNPDIIVSSKAEASLNFGESLKQLTIRLDRETLERDLVTLLGARPKETLEFGRAASCENGSVKRLRDHVIHTAASIDLFDEPLPMPLLREMDQSIRLAVLYGMPNNLTDLLYAPTRTIAPWQVMRVEQWIDANWKESVTIEKLVEISGASVRSIFATFRSTRGYTPMTYLKNARLDGAREMLLSGAPGASVTAIAFACRFTNTGHFANDYRRKFGELPSETLRRGRLIGG